MKAWGKEITEVGDKDVSELLRTDLVVCQIASPGAMGYHGGVFFVTSDRRIFYTCYLEPSAFTGYSSPMSWDNLTEVFPPVKDIDAGLTEPDGWHYEYLGFGNHLLVKQYLEEEFRKQAKSLLKKNPGSILYNKWLEAILSIL